MRTLSSLLVVGSLALLLSGCLGTTQAPSATQTTQPAVEKTGNTTKIGVISKIGEKYFLTESGKQPAEVDSYAIDLGGYVGKNVTIVGQYSGDTLFVGDISVN
jgi:hypothetical protein